MGKKTAIAVLLGLLLAAAGLWIWMESQKSQVALEFVQACRASKWTEAHGLLSPQDRDGTNPEHLERVTRGWTPGDDNAFAGLATALTAKLMELLEFEATRGDGGCVRVVLNEQIEKQIDGSRPDYCFELAREGLSWRISLGLAELSTHLAEYGRLKAAHQGSPSFSLSKAPPTPPPTAEAVAQLAADLSSAKELVAFAKSRDDSSTTVPFYPSLPSEADLNELVTELSSEHQLAEDHLERSKRQGLWRVTEEQDPMGEGSTVVLAAQSSEAIVSSFGMSSYPSLVLRCSKGKTEAYFHADTGLKSDWRSKSTPIRIRIDNGSPQPLLAHASSGGDAAFIARPIKFIEQLLGVNDLTVELQPYNRQPAAVRIDVRKLDAVLPKLRSACNW